MPLPMVHLAVAVQLCEAPHNIPSPAFLLGSIAPDAIHMRPGAGGDEKRRVHLLGSQDLNHERIRAFLAPYWAHDIGSPDLAEGYAVHLLTDRLWREKVIVPFRANVPQDIPYQDLRSLYYQDTDQIDFNLYYQMPWRAEVWAKLAAAAPEPIDALLTAQEIGLWRDRTLDWFEKLKKEPNIDPMHITDAVVRAFIDEAAAMARACLERWKSAAMVI